MSIPTPPTPAHPPWCAGPPTCTVEQPSGTHRSAPATFTAPAVRVEATLFMRAWPSRRDTFLTVAVMDPTGSGDGFHFTLALPDAWRLADTLTGLLELAR